jgi:predicted nucleic acid-binding Zn ribbon protein
MRCDKCKSFFPTKIKVGGVVKNLQNRRYCLDCSPFKQHNTRPILNGPLPIKHCRICERPLPNNRRNVCGSCCVIKAQRKRKIKAVQFYGGKCIGCGYNKCPGVLAFDHRDPATKEVAPSYAIMKWSWERAKKELDKCDLLCSNCHGERHWMQYAE